MSFLSVFLTVFLFHSIVLGKWNIVPQTDEFPDLDNVPDDGPLVSFRIPLFLIKIIADNRSPLRFVKSAIIVLFGELRAL
jgi:hypothetical protein